MQTLKTSAYHSHEPIHACLTCNGVLQYNTPQWGQAVKADQQCKGASDMETMFFQHGY